MHHHELVGQPLPARERIVFRARNDRGRVGPTWNDGRARGRSALVLDQPALHGLAKGDIHRRAPDEKLVHALQRGVHRRAAEIREQRRHLGEQVVERHHERRSMPLASEPGCESDDRRIGQRHEHVRPIEPQPGPCRRREVRHVVRRAPGESSLVESSPARTMNLDTLPGFARNDPALVDGCPGQRVQRRADHHGDAAAMVPDEVFAQVREQLAGCRLIRVVRTVEESDVHRCARFDQP
jgi:hypothetical protein